MNKIIQLSKVFTLIMLALFFIFTIGGKLEAQASSIIDTNRKASLTITKYEHTNGSEENKPFKGVEFTIYEIPNDANINTVSQAEGYVKNNSTVNSYTKTTPESGTIVFSDLNLGRYLVVETDAPKSVLTKSDSFLIDLPRTNNNGNSWDYDVTVYPKNVTIAGKAVLTHFTGEGNPLSGATWILQKKDNSGNWNDYTDVGTLTTNKEGKITVDNLEKGNYRFVQDSIEEGYILDKSRTVNFNIDLENLSQSLEAKSEKLNIDKYVKTTQGDYTKELGVYTTDKISWKIVSDVPSNITNLKYYQIIEKIPEGLNIESNTLYAYGQDTRGVRRLIPSNSFAKDVQNGQVTFNFITGKLSDYKKITIEYDTKFDYNNVNSGEFKSTATLKYTNNIDINKESLDTYTTSEKEAKVYTGLIKILKTDAAGTPLKGAKFKIATSKENAKNGTFLKDIYNTDIIAISNEEGYAIFGGLKYGEYGQPSSQATTSYWIVEIEAPSEKYNLLKSPEEVIVNANYMNNLKTIVNTEKLVLPLTGGKFNYVSIGAGTLLIFCAIVIKLKNKRKEKIEAK